MSRGREISARRREKRTRDQGDAVSLGRVGGAPAGDSRRPPERSHSRPRPGLQLKERGREEVVARGRSYSLRESDLETLHDIGRFRAVEEGDLGRFRYDGASASMEYDLRSLAEQGLVNRRTLSVGRGEPLSIVTLAKDGERLLGESANSSAGQAQRFYAGFVKPAEIPHDVAIYRMYQAEAAEIERSGGWIQRVVLDYELKSRVYSPLAKAREADDYAELQQEVARANDLEVIDGKIPLPDLRIEYETATGEREHVDLELATEHYRASQLATKAQAGFKLYGPASSGTAGGAVRDERELTAEILAL